jgi:hypothetical protein
MVAAVSVRDAVFGALAGEKSAVAPGFGWWGAGATVCAGSDATFSFSLTRTTLGGTAGSSETTINSRWLHLGHCGVYRPGFGWFIFIACWQCGHTIDNVASHLPTGLLTQQANSDGFGQLSLADNLRPAASDTNSVAMRNPLGQH